MANDISINLNGKDNASPAINKARQSLQQFAAQSNSVENIAKRFDKIQNSTLPLKKKLKEVQMLMAQLNLQGEDANSQIYNQMAQAAGEYRDAIADAVQATNMFANDTMKLQTGIDTMNVFAQAGQIAAGVTALFGEENENVTRVIMQLQSVMAIANGVQSIANLLNKDANIILRAKAIWEGIVTAAKVKDTAATTINTTASIANTAATKLSTVGQMAWNVAKAVGKALLGDFSGLVLVAAAGIGIYAMATDDSTEKQKENNAEMEKSQQIYADYSSTVAKSTGEMVGKFMVLRAEWNQLQSDAERTEWLENNANAMRDLGLEVNDVTGAENVFNKNTNAVVRALELRAQAMAAQQAIVAEYTKYYETLSKIDNSVKGGGYYYKASAGQEITKQEAVKAGIPINRNNFSTMHTLSEADAVKLNAYRMGQAHDLRQSNYDKAKAQLEAGTRRWLKVLQNISNQMAELPIQQYHPGSNRSSGSSRSGSSGSSRSGSSGSTEQPKTQDEILREAYDQFDQEISTIKSDFAKGLIDEKGFREKIAALNTKIKEAGFDNLEVDVDLVLTDHFEQQISDARDLFVDGLVDESAFRNRLIELNAEIQAAGLNNVVIDVDAVLKDATFDKLKRQYEELKTKLEDGDITEIQFNADVSSINKQLAAMGKRTFVIRTDYEVRNSGKRDKMNDATTRFSTLQSDFKLGIVGKEDVMKELAEINAIRESLGMEPIEITFTTDGVEDAKAKLDALKESILGMSGSIGQSVDQWATLGAYLKAGGDSGLAAAAGMSMVGDTMAQIGSDGMIAKIGATMAAVGQIILGFATASTQAAALGPFGWLAFVGAGLAAVATTIAQIKSYADGGIIEGNQFRGDAMLARVNAGELILNKTQQGNLFRMLDGGVAAGGGGGRVEFQISGTTLKGVLNNYDKKMDRLR